MPILADEISKFSQSFPPYFPSLSALDDHVAQPRLSSTVNVLPYIRRSLKDRNRGKLLVCHDYKVSAWLLILAWSPPEDSCKRAVTLKAQLPCRIPITFGVYVILSSSKKPPSISSLPILREGHVLSFSHQRVTIPPPGWINAAHRQGSKILGVLIFEHEQSAEENIRLLLGKIPNGMTTGVTHRRAGSLPISPYYAQLLAELAQERGFDGYLLNFEYKLLGGLEQARALEAWVRILRQELKEKVGEHAQTMWYDSIVVTGALAWQDRLNSRNLPFFLASDTFFTNYTWPNFNPSKTAQYFTEIDSSLFGENGKALCDIYVGVDVWPGRNCHGNGGFGAFKALEHIDPEFLGLSSAVFGPAWTWESEEDRPGWGWEEWWAYERRLWLGPEAASEEVPVTDTRMRKGEPPCLHPKFKPLSSFFRSLPPPDPKVLPFFTCFCPGVGYSWFARGEKLLHKDSGWTDIDKQTSIGDMLWPRPNVHWEDAVLEEALPVPSTSLSFTDAYIGGSSLTISLTGKEASAESFFRCFWIPIQSLSLSSGVKYEARIIYKARCEEGDIDLGFSVKSEGAELEIKPVASESSYDYANGWGRSTVHFTANNSDNRIAHFGVVIGAAFEEPSQPYKISVSLGQISIYPAKNEDASRTESRISWVHAQTDPSFPGVVTLTWDASLHFVDHPTLTQADIEPENTRPPWTLESSNLRQLRFLYFNVFLQSQVANAGPFPSKDVQFIGTTGYEGLRNQFSFDRKALPEGLRGPLRAYVQGVDEFGVVMPWERCAYVDFD